MILGNPITLGGGGGGAGVDVIVFAPNDTYSQVLCNFQESSGTYVCQKSGTYVLEVLITPGVNISQVFDPVTQMVVLSASWVTTKCVVSLNGTQVKTFSKAGPSSITTGNTYQHQNSSNISISSGDILSFSLTLGGNICPALIMKIREVTA